MGARLLLSSAHSRAALARDAHYVVAVVFPVKNNNRLFYQLRWSKTWLCSSLPGT